VNIFYVYIKSHFIIFVKYNADNNESTAEEENIKIDKNSNEKKKSAVLKVPPPLEYLPSNHYSSQKENNSMANGNCNNNKRTFGQAFLSNQYQNNIRYFTNYYKIPSEMRTRKKRRKNTKNTEFKN